MHLPFFPTVMLPSRLWAMGTGSRQEGKVRMELLFAPQTQKSGMANPGVLQRSLMIYGVSIPAIFEGKEIYRFPRRLWVYPIPIRGRFGGKQIYRFPRLILAGNPLIVSRNGADWKRPVQIGRGRRLTFKQKEALKRGGRPRKYATDAERMRENRRRKAEKEGRVYGQRWSRHKPKLSGHELE